MFGAGSISGTMPDLSGNFDWVRKATEVFSWECVQLANSFQNALDSYGQVSNFADQPLQFFNGASDDSPESMLDNNNNDGNNKSISEI
jgi:hypothetical protein